MLVGRCCHFVAVVLQRGVVVEIEVVVGHVATGFAIVVLIRKHDVVAGTTECVLIGSICTCGRISDIGIYLRLVGPCALSVDVERLEITIDDAEALDSHHVAGEGEEIESVGFET